MADRQRVDVLIVTLCAPERAASIRRAVAAAQDQAGVDVRVVIVVNGRRYDRATYDELRTARGVDVVYQEEPSIFLARRRAREHVTAPYFGFIDDDDVYLPGALATRTEALLRDATADAVVTNGLLATDGVDAPMLVELDVIRADPLVAMLRDNWLATASAQFRTASITPDFFDVTLRTNDMTYLGVRLALERKVAFVDAPTYRKFYSADSISLTDDWVLPSLDTLEKLDALPLPARARVELRRKIARTAHEISNLYRRRGERGAAWRYHLRSLASPWGLVRYALHTRHLVGNGDV